MIFPIGLWNRVSHVSLNIENMLGYLQQAENMKF